MQLTIKNSQGTPLTATFHQGESRATIILVSHGYKSSSKHPAILNIVSGLNKLGYTTCRFDFSPGSEINIEQQIQDTESIIAHFKDYKEIILLSGSLGALTSAATANKSKRVSRLITVNGFFGSLRLGPKYRKPFVSFRLAALISPKHKELWRAYKKWFKPQNISIPTLVIHSKSDEIVYYRQSLNFYKRLAGPKRLKTLHGIDHNISTLDGANQIVSAVDTWLKD